MEPTLPVRQAVPPAAAPAGFSPHHPDKGDRLSQCFGSVFINPGSGSKLFLNTVVRTKKNLLSKYRILDYWSPTLRFRIRSNSSIRNFRPIPCFVNLTFSYGSNNITETFIKFHNFLGTGIFHISKICIVHGVVAHFRCGGSLAAQLTSEAEVQKSNPSSDLSQ